MKQWIRSHPDLWQFILFNLLSNCATVTNFVVMWLCTRFLFAPLADRFDRRQNKQASVWLYPDRSLSAGRNGNRCPGCIC